MAGKAGSVCWGHRTAGCSPAVSLLCSQRWGWWQNISQRSGCAVQCFRASPTPKMCQAVWQTEPRGRSIPEQKHWGQRRPEHPSAGLLRGWCFVLARRLSQKLGGNAHPRSGWGDSGLRISPKLGPIIHRQEGPGLGRTASVLKTADLSLDPSSACLSLLGEVTQSLKASTLI